MALLASDAQNPEFTGAYNPDSRLAVQFYSRAVQNEFQSNLQGRPIFDDVDFVKIFVPGDNTMTIDTAVHESHKKRFPLQWAHYQNNRNSDEIHGTAISSWPLLSAGQVEQLKALKFYTVESIATASDSQIANVGMVAGMQPHAFRDRANLFLRVAGDDALAAKQAAENSELKDRLAKLEAMLAQQSEPDAEKRSPGRQRKE